MKVKGVITNPILVHQLFPAGPIRVSYSYSYRDMVRVRVRIRDNLLFP